MIHRLGFWYWKLSSSYFVIKCKNRTKTLIKSESIEIMIYNKWSHALKQAIKFEPIR